MSKADDCSAEDFGSFGIVNASRSKLLFAPVKAVKDDGSSPSENISAAGRADFVGELLLSFELEGLGLLVETWGLLFDLWCEGGVMNSSSESGTSISTSAPSGTVAESFALGSMSIACAFPTAALPGEGDSTAAIRG